MHALKALARRWFLAGLIGLGACGPKPACQQIASGGRSIASWATTAQMIARRWSAGDVPASYAHDTLTQGAQQIRAAAVKLESAPNANDPAARAAHGRYQAIAAALIAIDHAIATGDRRGVAALAVDLPTAAQQIDAMRARCQAQIR